MPQTFTPVPQGPVPARPPVALRPLGVGEIIDVSIKLYIRNALTLWKLVAIVVVPTQLLGAMILASVTPSEDEVTGFITTQGSSNPFGALAAGALVTVVLYLLATMLSTAVSVKAVRDIYLGGEPDASASLGFVGRRLGSLLWMAVVAGFVGGLLLLGTGFVTFVLAGLGGIFGFLLGFGLYVVVAVSIFVSWSVSVPVLLIEDRRGWRALERSTQLTRKRFFPTLGVMVLGTIITYILQFLLQLALQPALSFAGDSLLATFLTAAIGQTISSLLVLPFFATAITILYFDLRVRQEGFDLELMAQSMGPGGPPSPLVGPPAGPAPYATQFAARTMPPAPPGAPLAPPPGPPPGAAPPGAPPAPRLTPRAPTRPEAKPPSPALEDPIDDLADIEDAGDEARAPEQVGEPQDVSPQDVSPHDVSDEDDEPEGPLAAAQPPWATAPIKRPVPKRPAPRRPVAPALEDPFDDAAEDAPPEDPSPQDPASGAGGVEGARPDDPA